MTSRPADQRARSSNSDRWGLAALVVCLLYVSAVLAGAIARTRHLEQDGAYYVHVTERAVQGKGFTSLSDRRGPAPWAPYPQPFSATNRWPWLLAGFTLLTGDARTTGMALSAVSFVAAIALLAALLRSALCRSWWIAGLMALAALLHRRTLGFMVEPLSDATSLLLNIAVVWAVLERRRYWALLLVALACVTRFQNVALVFPLTWLLLQAWPRLRVASLAGGAVAGLVLAGPAALDGIRTFLDPTESVSLLRTMRFLSLPLLVGLWSGWRDVRLRPFLLLGLGHFLVILANPDRSMATPWLFGERHALPLLVVAAACSALAAARSRGWLRLVIVLLAVVALVDHGGKIHRLMRDRPQRTALPAISSMEHYLRRHPLGPDAIVLCHDCDVLALELGLRAVHLRGFDPDDPAFLEQVHERHISHVLLTWADKHVLAARNAWMTAIEHRLEPPARLVHATEAPDGRWRAVLLELP